MSDTSPNVLYKLRRKDDSNDVVPVETQQFLIGRGRDCNLRIEDMKALKKNHDHVVWSIIS